MKQEKKKKMMTIAGIVLLLLIVIGASYAYFIAQTGNGASTNITVEADTVDSLQFATGDPISININQENFASGAGNKKGSTTARATLIAGTNRTPSYTYNVYLVIDVNELKYTTSDNKPELILKVTGPNNTAITTIDGLTYSSTLGGFDITESEGVFTIVSDYTITTTSNEMHIWKTEIEVINLDSNQSRNAGSLFKAKILIQQNTLAETLADVCASGDNFTNCLKDYADSSTYYISRILHHDENLENGAKDDSYRYSGGEFRINTKYMSEDYAPIRGNLITLVCQRRGIYSNVSYMNWTDSYLSTCTDMYYRADYDGKYETYEDALQYLLENGYVKKTPSINNYVCFGSNEETCPKDNLYRIVGVFGDKVKLVKADVANSNLLGTDGDFVREYNSNTQYYWGWSNFNDKIIKNSWEESDLNMINLNTNYLNNIGTTWADMIETVTWNVGGFADISNRNYAKAYYDAEFGTSGSGNEVKTNAKIGMLYASDYLYGIDPIFWGEKIDDSYISPHFVNDSNWMFIGNKQVHLISRNSNGTFGAWEINYVGNLEVNQLQTIGPFVLPTFYLKSTIKYNSGNGTVSDPYRIK